MGVYETYLNYRDIYKQKASKLKSLLSGSGKLNTRLGRHERELLQIPAKAASRRHLASSDRENSDDDVDMKNNKKKDRYNKGTAADGVRNPSPSKVLVSHLICGIGLVSSFWLAINVFFISLIDNPVETLRLLWMIEVPVVILVYSFFRKDKNRSSYLKAVARGLLGLPVGAVVNSLGAIALGAPVGTRYFLRTFNWSLLMSAFTFVPAASVYGSSWVDWHRVYAHTKPIGFIDYMICIPAYGAVIGGWFGAWPMPLDWERPWQEWPICVTYGAIIGYFIGMLASFGCVVHVSRQHVKGD